MNEQSQERFDLSKLVLGYLEDVGSVVMPPEFEIYEVLMPDTLAKGLGVAEHVRLNFAARKQQGLPADVVQLGVTHPLVEKIAESLIDQPANTQSYVRGLRIDKRGLADLARSHFDLPNARLDEIPKTTEEATRHHYLLCNFKVTLLSEEKQEELVTLIMDLQAGHVVEDEAVYRQLAIIDPEPAHGGLPIAPPRWSAPNLVPKDAASGTAGDALDPAIVQALLPRAEAALREKVADQVAAQAARMERHLALDLARIGDYYDEMAADLTRRRARLAGNEMERQQGFDEKLALLTAERAQKLDDARGRYRLRAEMALINVLLATQPKVVLPMTISNRTAKITRTIVWDPLRRQLEPLVCDVCGKPGAGLHLCTGGHLVHEACLAPQCIDCKREFCQRCATQITACVVCGQPVCRSSLIKCPTCGRGTCNDHRQLCHAADGQPATLATTAPPETTTPPATPSRTPSSPPPKQPPATGTKSKTPATAAARKQRTKAKPAVKSDPVVKGAHIDIQIYEDRPLIAAFVMRSTSRVLATRSIELTPRGILVHCDCEKPNCEADGYYFRPLPVTMIEKQVTEKLRELQQEYLVPAKKIHYITVRFGQPVKVKRFTLPEQWRDPTLVAEAQQGFDGLR